MERNNTHIRTIHSYIHTHKRMRACTSFKMNWIDAHSPDKIGEQCDRIKRVPLPINDTTIHIQRYLGPRLQAGMKHIVITKEEIALLAHDDNKGNVYSITDLEFDTAFLFLVDMLNSNRDPGKFWKYTHTSVAGGGFALQLIQVPL